MEGMKAGLIPVKGRARAQAARRQALVKPPTAGRRLHHLHGI